MTDRMDTEALRALVALEPMIAADYTDSEERPAWAVIPASCVGTFAMVRPDRKDLAVALASAPVLAAEVLVYRAALAQIAALDDPEEMKRIARDAVGG